MSNSLLEPYKQVSSYSNGEGRREVVGDSQDGWSCGIQLLPLAHRNHTHLLLHCGRQDKTLKGHSIIYNTSLIPRPHQGEGVWCHKSKSLGVSPARGVERSMKLQSSV